MTSDLYQLISQLAQLEHSQNQQILSINGNANLTMQPNRNSLSSDGPNASQRIQVANSNIHQVNFILNFLGHPGLGIGAIANGDNGAYPNNQDSQSTAISHASQPTIEAAESIDSNSVQNVQPSDPTGSADEEDINAKLDAGLADLGVAKDAVKGASYEVFCATGKLTEATDKLTETTAKFSEWITALNWPTFKLGLVNEQAITLGDLAAKHCMSTIKLSQSIIEFGRSSIQLGESTVEDALSVLMAVHNSFTGMSTSEFEETTIRYRESCTTFMERLPIYDTTGLEESARAHEISASQLKELIGPVVDFDAFEEIAVDLGKSANTVGKLLTAFGGLIMVYSTAVDGVLARTKHLVSYAISKRPSV